MAFIQLHLFSESLGMQTTVGVVLPQKSTAGEIGTANKAGDDQLKCLYLLHGLSDDQTIWMRRTSIERYAANYGLCVVMPTGAKSFYTDMTYGMKYYTYIAKELPRIIESMFRVSDRREDRFIGGLSMGGYGALKIALRETGRYGAAVALSPVSDIHNPRFTEVLKPVFGETVPEEADLFHLITAHDSDAVKPRVYMTVGKEDFMYDDTARLNDCIAGLHYDYRYEETDGGHSWDVWDQAIQRALSWLL